MKLEEIKLMLKILKLCVEEKNTQKETFVDYKNKTIKCVTILWHLHQPLLCHVWHNKGSPHQHISPALVGLNTLEEQEIQILTKRKVV